MKISGHGLDCELTFSPADNEGWMRTTVQLKVASFEGGFACTVEKEEWKSFVQALRHLESSVGKDAEASWGNMEENIEFHFILHKRGAIEAMYKFSPENFSLGPTLSGTFEADQTFLPSWARSAQQVLENAR
jgi:hypothetical protein